MLRKSEEGGLSPCVLRIILLGTGIGVWQDDPGHRGIMTYDRRIAAIPWWERNPTAHEHAVSRMKGPPPTEHSANLAIGSVMIVSKGYKRGYGEMLRFRVLDTEGGAEGAATLERYLADAYVYITAFKQKDSPSGAL